MNVVDIIQLRLFLAELTHARVPEKDLRVDEAISRMLECQPDAAYLLVQRVMQLENALCAAARTAGPRPFAHAAPADARPAAHAAHSQVQAPWWLQPAATFAGVAFLAQSAEYLLGSWT